MRRRRKNITEKDLYESTRIRIVQQNRQRKGHGGNKMRRTKSETEKKTIGARYAVDGLNRRRRKNMAEKYLYELRMEIVLQNQLRKEETK